MRTFAIVIIVIAFSCSNQDLDIETVKQIGISLMESDSLISIQSSIPVVSLGKGLSDKIAEIKTHTKSYDIEVSKGDFKNPYGNNKADFILIINNDYQKIGIRLKKLRSDQKFDILGWMSLND